MAKYSDWNKWLVDYFFNDKNAHKEVFLIACPEVINEIGYYQGIELPEKDFIEAIRNCDLRKPIHVLEKKNIIQVVDSLRGKHVTHDYQEEPQYVAFLAFLVYSISISDDLTGKNQIPDIERVLREKNLREDYNKSVPRMWKDIEKWTAILDYERGKFRAEHIPNFENVGYAFRQALFLRKHKKQAIDAFHKLRMQPGIEITRKQADQILCCIFKSYKDNETIREFLADRVIDVYNQWDGSDSSGTKPEFYSLRMALVLDDFEGRVQFRAKVKNPENIGLRSGEAINFNNNYSLEWSDLNWSGSFIKGGEYWNSAEILNGKVSLYSSEINVRINSSNYTSPIIFDNGDDLAARGCWIETLSPISKEILVLSQQMCSGDGVRYLDYEGIPDEWYLYKIDVTTALHNGTDLPGIKEKLERVKDGDSVLVLSGGVTFRNEYFRFAPPLLKVFSNKKTEVYCDEDKLEKKEYYDHYDISDHIKDNTNELTIRIVCDNVSIEERRIKFVQPTLDNVEHRYFLDRSGCEALDGVGICGGWLNDEEYVCSECIERKQELHNRSFVVDPIKIKIPQSSTHFCLNNEILQVVKHRKAHKINHIDLKNSIQGIMFSKYKITEPDPTDFIINALVDIGFLERFNNHYSLTPPSFVQKVSKNNEAFLTGWRDKEMVDYIISLSNSENVGVVVGSSYGSNDSYLAENEWFNLFPTPINIVARDAGSLYAFIEKTGINFSKNSNSWGLLNWAAGKDEVLEKIKSGWTYRESIDWKNTYNFDTLGWCANIPVDSYGFYMEEHYTGTQFYLYKNKNVARVSYDWGINICLGESDKYSLFYDEGKKILLCPYKARLPHLISRAVALCDGSVPRLWGHYFESGNKYLGEFPSIRHLGWHNKWFIAYHNVSSKIASKVAQLTNRKIDEV